MRLIARVLDVPVALLFTATPEGRLRPVARVGTSTDGAVLRGLAENLGQQLDVLDVSGAVDGARFAAGTRLGDGEGALLVLAPDDRRPDQAWADLFAETALVALSLVRAHAAGRDRQSILYEVAAHAGSFKERLTHALRRASEVLDLDAAFFAEVRDGRWVPHTVVDPTGELVSTTPLALGDTLCSITCQADGPFGMENAESMNLGIAGPPSYLGAPVCSGGRCVGTFCVVGGAARERPFTDEERTFVESLARWVGVAFSSRESARQLAAREADLAAFFEGTRLGMGTVRLVDGDDLEFVSVNAAAASAFGGRPDEIAGRRVSHVVGPSLVKAWVDACRHAAEAGRGHRIEVAADTTQGVRTLATTVAAVADATDSRYTFVIEDVTSRRAEIAPAEPLARQAPGALFATDDAGRVVAGRGRVLGTIGLTPDEALGQSLPDLLDADLEAQAIIRAALAGREGAWTTRIGDRTYGIRVGPRRDRTGRIVGLVGVVMDVSDLFEGGDGISASESRGAFLKHLNHELRSPLTAVLGYAELLGAETPPVEVTEVRDVIIRSGERLIGALDDLRDLMLLDDSTVTATPTPTDVCSLVSTVADASRTAAEARRIALSVWCLLPPAPLLLDGALFERIARHLIGGAVASARGSRVDIRLSDDGPQWFVLSVTGGANDGEPMGIGPELVHRLVTAMGGTSTEHGGETPGWEIRLPRHPALMVDLDARDGATGEAPTVAVSEHAG